MNKLVLVSIPFVLMTFGGCSGSGGDDDPAPDGGGSTVPGTGGETVDPGEVPETPVEGVWESGCLAAGADALGRRLVVRVTDDGDTGLSFGLIDTTYGDARCSEGDALRDIETRGTFSEQLFGTGEDPSDGIPIDLAVEQVLLKPRIRQVADNYNDRNLCGITNWTVGVDQDISDADTFACADNGGVVDGISTDAPRTDYNRLLVRDGGTPDVRADDELLLGTFGAQTDPEARPVAVSEETVLTRRPGTLARPGSGL